MRKSRFFHSPPVLSPLRRVAEITRFSRPRRRNARHKSRLVGLTAPDTFPRRDACNASYTGTSIKSKLRGITGASRVRLGASGASFAWRLWNELMLSSLLNSFPVHSSPATFVTLAQWERALIFGDSSDAPFVSFYSLGHCLFNVALSLMRFSSLSHFESYLGKKKRTNVKLKRINKMQEKREAWKCYFLSYRRKINCALSVLQTFLSVHNDT